MIRAIILSATIAALVVLWMDKPPPVKAAVKIDYCLIDEQQKFERCDGLKYTLHI